ncbi:MAG: zinc-ribbon domain-containing protein [Sphingomonas bacterium]|nr:zinc-ribbon domain-containing protein [Sphingomonas bacterium]
MILTCPACATQYRLKDGAIPPEGRQVRCAACKHKWHENGPATSDAAPAPAEDGAAGQWPVAGEPTQGDEYGGVGGGPPQPQPSETEQASASIPEAAARDQMVAETPEPEVAGQDPAAGNDAVAPAADHDRGRNAGWGAPVDPYPTEDHGFAAIPAMHDDDEVARGSKLGWIVGLILLVVAAAAAFYFFAPPELKARAGIAETGESPLQLMLTTSDRQRLASGNELVAISGRVINTTDREQAVPPIHAELRDPTDNRLVYQWTIAPPARSLAPGAAASFNSAEVDVPQGGESLSLRFAS